MSQSDTKLSLRTDGMSIELDGDADDIRRAYGALRDQLVEHFYRSMARQRGPEDQTLELAAPGGPDAQRGDQPGDIDDADADGDGDHFIHLCVCDNIYKKMYLLEDRHARTSFLSELFCVDHLHRIYVDAGAEDFVSSHVNLGATIWRELTAAGKAAVGRSQ